MKRNVSGLMAIVLAIGFSAFTTEHPTKKSSLSSYYWYQVSGTQTNSNRLNASPVDKAAAMSSLTPCNDQATDNCLFGSTNANLAIGSNIGSPTPDRLIKESQ